MLVIFYLDKEVNERMLNKRSPSATAIRQKRVDSRESTPVRQLKKHEESNVIKKVVQCALLNGGIFLLSILLFEYGVLPSINKLFDLLFGTNSFMTRVVWYWIEYISLLLFRTAWVIPLFLLSKIINALWFQDIADSAYRYSRGRPVFFQSISKFLADSIFSVVIQFLFLFQATLSSYIPLHPVGYILALAQTCLLYSLYSFEYKWFNMGWELHKRLTFIEVNWPYFIGFGLPLAVVTQLSESWIISGCLFSILFPLFIISGNEANPVTGINHFSVHFFSPVVAVSNTLFSVTIGNPKRRVTRSSAETTRAQQQRLH
ncbi:etoposide-induced protein 2.4 homolog isoform X2 [Cylas formicarius]|nr:etoposide-induced protein 2.4 homolog isoform X2 [Cylas formicarius]